MPGNGGNHHHAEEPELKRARHNSPPRQHYYHPEGIPRTPHFGSSSSQHPAGPHLATPSCRIPRTPNFGASPSGGPAGPPPATPTGPAGPAHGYIHPHTPEFVGGATGSWSGWHPPHDPHHDGYHPNDGYHHRHRDYHNHDPSGWHQPNHHHQSDDYDHHHRDNLGPNDLWNQHGGTVATPWQHEVWQQEVWLDDIHNHESTADHWRFLVDEDRWSWGKWYRGKFEIGWRWVEELD